MKLDEEALISSILAAMWERETRGEEELGLEGEVQWIRGVMFDACNASMPRVHPSPKRAAYWWTEEIADLRRSSVQARRTLDRALRAKNSPHRAARIEEAAEIYKAAREALRRAIIRVKARAWDELVLALDKDPWGRPHRIVSNKLKGGATPMTETLDPQFVHRIVTSLFPVEEGVDPIPAPDSGPE